MKYHKTVKPTHKQLRKYANKSEKEDHTTYRTKHQPKIISNRANNTNTGKLQKNEREEMEQEKQNETKTSKRKETEKIKGNINITTKSNK